MSLAPAVSPNKTHNFMTALVPIRAHERRSVGLLLLHSFLVGLTTSVFFVVANGYYLQQATVQQLPWVYVGAGIAGLAMVAGYKKLQHLIGVQRTYAAVLGFVALLATCLWLAYQTAPGHTQLQWWLASIGFGSVYPLSVLLVMGFAQVHTQHFSLEQMRRLGSLTGTGEVVASVLGYLTIPVMLQQGLPVTSLYLISAALACVSLLPLLRLPKPANSALSAGLAAAPSPAAPVAGQSRVFGKAIALFSFLMVLLMFVSDYAYLLAVKELASITAMKAAILVSYLFSIIKTGEFLVSLFSGRLLSSLGLQKAFWLLPMLGLGICGAAALALLLFQEPLLFLIIFLLLNKVVERVLRKALIQPALKVVYQAADASERIALQTRFEGFLNQMATITAGLLLLALLAIGSNSQSSLLFFQQAVGILLLAGLAWLAATRYLLSAFRTRVRKVVLTNKPAPAGSTRIDSQDTQLAAIEAYWQEASADSLTQLLQQYFPTPLKAAQLQHPAAWANLFVRETYPYSRSILLRSLPLMEAAQQAEAVAMVLPAANSFQQWQLLQHVVADEGLPLLQAPAAGLVEATAGRIVWAMGLLHDCRDLHPVLHTQARQVLRRQQQLLLALFRAIYGKDHLPDDQHLLNWETAGDEQLLFALELLEANLPDYHRSLALPLFQPLAWPSFERKIRPHFPVEQRSAEQRSQDWLMAEYPMVMPHHKLWFLEHCPAPLLPAEVLDAMRQNSWPFLQQLAQARHQGKPDPYLQLRKQAAEEVNKRLLNDYVFLAHGMQAQTVVRRRLHNRWAGHAFMKQFTQPNYICYIDLIAATISLQQNSVRSTVPASPLIQA